jgi:FkbM family methyltransferase
VVDVGANVGDTLLQVAGIADARVLCVEADARYLPLLRQNSAGLAGVTCVQAICDEEERTSDTDLVHRSGTSRVTSGGRTNTASTERRHTTLDALMVAQHGMRVNVLKVDTDGYDYRVLRGARRALERDRPALLIELAPEYLTAAGDDPKTLFPFLAGAGYGEALFYDNIGRPLVRVETASTKALEDLLAYQALGGVAYYDVIAFHASRSAEFDDFLAQERAFFLAHVEPPLKILTPA